LGVFASATLSIEEGKEVIAMIDDQLRDHSDSAVQSAAIDIFTAVAMGARSTSSLKSSVDTLRTTAQTIFHWALKLDNDKLYREAGSQYLKWLDTQDAVLGMVGRHLQSRSVNNSETIQWETW
jgi:hypothetical protein